MNTSLYPPSPADLDSDKLAISPSFRKEVRKVITSIFLFIIVYLLLVVLAIGLAIACGWLGFLVIIHLTNLTFLLVGAGLIALGVSVVGFLVKFIFAVARDENLHRIEITEAEQPRLFAFIRQLAQETHTPFPKKIYLSPEVNACVFYNSSFWSMFLPVRKNLEIGLGLVNSINISEFKAVIAHEFGHFSQRSMKLGSFTYNVNRIIYNMLYDNKDYTAFLQTWGRLHSYLRFFALITVKIATGIQWILRGMYKVINKNYFGLAREMEFHADAVAAGVSGGNNLVSALGRIEVAAGCYHAVLNDAGDQLKNNRITRNIFPNQLTIFRTLAEEHRLPIREGLPEISHQFIESFSRSRINYKNQWASHPTLLERKSSVDSLDISTPPDNTSAWELFDQVEFLQETATSSLYRSVTIEGPTERYDAADFQVRYQRRQREYALPEIYKGFYDGRYIEMKDWDFETLAGSANSPSAPIQAAGPHPTLSFDRIFSEDNGQLRASIDANKKDIEILKAIKEKKIDIKSFDFDGARYAIQDCDTLISRLEEEISALQSRQKSLDLEAFQFLLHQPGADKEEILRLYRGFRDLYARHEEYNSLVNQLMARVNPFYAQTGLTLDEVNSVLKNLKGIEEPALKKAYRQMLEEDFFRTENIPPASNTPPDNLPEKIKDFLAKDYVYFINRTFLDNELTELTGLAIRVAEVFNKQLFNSYKIILIVQAPGS